jgi:hypothetical protein
LSRSAGGIVLASSWAMGQTPVSTYDEPTVMWRMRRRDGQTTHAVIRLKGRRAWVLWFLNGRPLGRRDFDDWASAIRWCDQMRAQNWTFGWRLAPERDDVPAKFNES